MSLINEISLRLQTLPGTRPRDARGASLVEYALLIALIAVVCIVAVNFFGGETSSSFSRTANSISNA